MKSFPHFNTASSQSFPQRGCCQSKNGRTGVFNQGFNLVSFFVSCAANPWDFFDSCYFSAFSSDLWMQISPSVSSCSLVGLLIAAECSYTQMTPSVLWFPTLLICCTRGDVINQQQRWHHVLSSRGGGYVFLQLMWDSWWRPQLRFGDFLAEEGLSFLLWEDAKLMLPISSRDFGQQKHKYSSDPQTSSKLCSGRPKVLN